MENYTVLVPPYTVGPEAYRSIPEYCRVYGTTAVVIGGKKAMAAGPLPRSSGMPTWSTIHIG